MLLKVILPPPHSPMVKGRMLSFDDQEISMPGSQPEIIIEIKDTVTLELHDLDVAGTRTRTITVSYPSDDYGPFKFVEIGGDQVSTPEVDDSVDDILSKFGLSRSGSLPSKRRTGDND
jgi:hypothetical protein